MKRLYIEFEDIDAPSFFNYERFNSWVDIIAEHYDRRVGKLSFIYCNDDKILEVNKQFLDHDYYTDVITFDYCRRNIISGDIYISVDTVLSNSVQFSTSFEEEFNRVFCHAILHLIGYKDKQDNDALEMRAQESKCLELLKLVGV